MQRVRIKGITYVTHSHIHTYYIVYTSFWLEILYHLFCRYGWIIFCLWQIQFLQQQTNKDSSSGSTYTTKSSTGYFYSDRHIIFSIKPKFDGRLSSIYAFCISLTSSNNQFSEFRIFCLFTFLLIFLWNTFFLRHV